MRPGTAALQHSQFVALSVPRKVQDERLRRTVPCISLICTVHDEVGCANVAALLAILEKLQPEVAFVEVPPAAFDDYFVTFKGKNLESIAIQRYREAHPLVIIPVDRPTPDREFFEAVAELQNTIRAESAEYRQLKSQEQAHVERYGLAYLNSDYCSTLHAGLYYEIERTLNRLGDPRLQAFYVSWRKILDLREAEMLKNIHHYCATSSFDRGVFLIGAAHRKYIIEKLQALSPTDSDMARWDLSAGLNQANPQE